MQYEEKLKDSVIKLNDLLKALLNPETGCVWDLKQNLQSITGNVLEECYELIEALKEDDPQEIREEAGDVLFQVAFIAYLTKNKFNFTLADIIEDVTEKMISRHPHVFSNISLNNSEDILNQWQKIKREKRKDTLLLDSIPKALPGLQKAHRLSERVGRVGFDWSSAMEVREKLNEEIKEFDEVFNSSEKNKAQLKHELGDMLFALANLARHLGFSAEEAIYEANNRFISRFNFIEKELLAVNKTLENTDLAEMEKLWAKAKQKECLK